MAVLWLSLHPMVPQALLPSHDYLILLSLMSSPDAMMSSHLYTAASFPQ